MILDQLEQAEQYTSLNKHFAKAFAFLRQANLHRLSPGSHEIAGKDVYAVIVKAAGNGHNQAKLEAHRKYIDIQYLLTGSDEMGWKSLKQCTSRQTDYDAEKDAELFSDVPDTWIKVEAGSFAIFFPEDAHAPGAGDGKYHKVVVKVRMK